MAPAGFGDKVEGLQAVKAAIAAARVEQLWVERGRARRAEFGAVIARAEELGACVHLVESVHEYAETDAPQGLVAQAKPIKAKTVEELASGPAPALVVLDHVVDPRNLGAVARSARAAGMTGLVVADRRAAPLSAVAFKAAAGSLETLPVAIVNSIPDALARLAKGGVWTVGLATGSDTPLFGLDLLAEPVALVVGGEGSGLSRLVRERCDVIATIPMSAGVESLNASVAAALGAYEIMRMRAG